MSEQSLSHAEGSPSPETSSLQESITDSLGRPVDGTLYDAIVALGKTHPAFASWSLLVRATTYQDIKRQELLEHIEYLGCLEDQIRADTRLSLSEKVAQLHYNTNFQRSINELLYTIAPFA